jgi:tetratricopeptide (TPR) repeat protein
MTQSPRAISASRTSTVPSAFVLALGLAWSVSPASAQQLDRASVTSRAQTAYFSEDAAGLGRLEASARAWSRSKDPIELYTYAFVQLRIAQLATKQKKEDAAEAAGKACVAALDIALEGSAGFTEGHALQSACYGYLANLGGLGAIRNGSRSGKSIDRALAQSPRNPRVILVEAMGYYFRPSFAGGDEKKACARFLEAVSAFDKDDGANGIRWGAPEAHYWVGRCKRAEGDPEAERQFFQRALQLAPNFAAAKRALGR